MSDSYGTIFSRNRGLLTAAEQSKLWNTSIAIAGVGGVGGLLAERLMRLGVGRIRITDPGDFEESNSNRQFGSSKKNLGQNKASVVSRELKDINPRACIEWDDRGIHTEDDAVRLASGCDLVIDEMDFGLFRESIRLQRAARDKGVYYLFTSAMGFGAMVVVFDPRGMTLEEYDGFPPDLDLGQAEMPDVPLERIAPVIPSYVKDIPPADIERYIAGEAPGPATSIGAGIASLLAATEAMNIVLNKRPVATAPSYTYVDFLDQQLRIGVVALSLGE